MKINVLKDNDHKYNPLKKQQLPALLSRQYSHIISSYNKSTNVVTEESFFGGQIDFNELVAFEGLIPTNDFNFIMRH